MSEKRKPDATLVLQTRSGQKYRYEIFDGAQFAERMAHVSFCHAEQPNLQILPIDLDNTHYVRVRCNGVWMPTGRRALYPAQRVAFLIGQHLQGVLRKDGE